MFDIIDYCSHNTLNKCKIPVVLCYCNNNNSQLLDKNIGALLLLFVAPPKVRSKKRRVISLKVASQQTEYFVDELLNCWIVAVEKAKNFHLFITCRMNLQICLVQVLPHPTTRFFHLSPKDLWPLNNVTPEVTVKALLKQLLLKIIRILIKFY